MATVFPDDTYVYDYYGWTLNIDSRTLILVPEADNSFLNGYKGDISGQTDALCPEKLYINQGNYSMYFTFEFIQNFARTVVDRYSPYKAVLINASWVRTDTFQFRLVDL